MFSSYDMKRFGKKIKEIRKGCDLSQASVANSSSVSIDTLRRIENGYVTPRYETLVTLTNIYNKDLLQLFHNFTEDLDCITYYNQIDEAIIENDINVAKSLYDELTSKILDKKIMSNQVDQTNYNQIIRFLEARQLFYTDRVEKKLKIELSIINGIKMRIEDYKIENFENYNYTFIELRLLLLLTTSYEPAETLKTSILIFLHNKFSNNTFERNNLRLNLLILYNLSYTSFRLRKDQEAIQWSNEAITLALEKRTGYLLPYLFTRRAVSNFFLNEPYEQDVISSLQAINLFYNSKVKSDFKDVYSLHKMNAHCFD